MRNARVLHGFVPVATEVGPTLVGTYNDVSRLDPVDPGAWWIPSQVPAIRAVLARTRGEPARDAALTDMAVGYMASHPFYVLRVMTRNTLRLAELTEPSGWRAAGAGMDMPAAAGVLTSAWFWLVLVLAIAGLALGARGRAAVSVAHRGPDVPVGSGGDQRRPLPHAARAVRGPARRRGAGAVREPGARLRLPHAHHIMLA